MKLPRIVPAILADPLNPNDFASLGTLEPGFFNYTIQEGPAVPTLSLGGVTLYTGVISNGNDVFNFDGSLATPSQSTRQSRWLFSRDQILLMTLSPYYPAPTAEPVRAVTAEQPLTAPNMVYIWEAASVRAADLAKAWARLKEDQQAYPMATRPTSSGWQSWRRRLPEYPTGLGRRCSRQ